VTEENVTEVKVDLLQTLQGDIYSQGVKTEVRAWLDMGSAIWAKTSGEEKAAAYQAALNCSWTDASLKRLITSNFEHLDDSMADYIINSLRELKEEHPIDTEEVFSTKNPEDKVIRREKNDDNNPAVKEKA